jgi:TRAP transporter 4TM/12TM fusion protein
VRDLKSWIKIPVIVYGVAASLIHLYTAGFGTFEPRTMRSMHLMFLLPMVYILFPATARSPKDRPSVLDVIASLFCFAAPFYIFWNAESLNFRMIGVDDVLPIEIFLGTGMVLLVIEACRRSLSQWMALTIGITLVYFITSPYWPGLFRFKGYSFSRMVEILYLAGDEGMFGFLTGISSNILFIYIIFASFMLFAGVGNFFINFTIWAAGWARGGAAKIAIIASALYGTVSGSTVANVYATGSFTIPLMKRSGFIPRQAAAIEAVAGTGGQIMPPIMGAGAFIMSEITGIPYFDIIKAAAIPAILYYVGLFFIVHFISLRQGMASIPASERPGLRAMLRNAYFFLPFLLIVLFLGYGYSPSKSAFFVVLVIFAMSFLDRKTWMTPKKVIDTLYHASYNAAIIATALAGSGMIVGILTRTGTALSFGSVLSGASYGSLLLAMILVFLVVSVLGTGIPTTPAYIIAVTVGASGMMSTGVEAFRLGLVGFLVPFAFVFQPALLLQGTVTEVILATATTCLGVACLAAFLIGHIWSPLSWLQRGLFFCAAFILVFPAIGMEVLGVLLAVALFVWAKVQTHGPMSIAQSNKKS